MRRERLRSRSIRRFNSVTSFSLSRHFCPDELLDNWEEIVRAWVNGERVRSCGRQKMRKCSDSSRALWCTTSRLGHGGQCASVRLRSIRIKNMHTRGRGCRFDRNWNFKLQRCTANQAGLASRVAALKAIDDCEGDFNDFRGLRAWLKSDCVVSRQSDGEWPTKETANLWRAFVESFEGTIARRWTIQTLDLAVEWDAESPRLVRTFGSYMTPQMERSFTPSNWTDSELWFLRFRNNRPEFCWQQVSSSAGRIAAEYLGPFDLARK